MKKIFEKIGRDVWFYIAWIATVCVLWTAVFGIITRVRDEEKIVVFIGTRSQSFDKYSELKESCPEYVLELELNVYSVEEKNFSQLLSVFGTGESDVLILSETYLQNESSAIVYAEIPSEYISLFSNLGTFEVDGKVLGLKIHDKDTHESIVSCLDFGTGDTEENYYLVFNRNSLHLGVLSSEVTERSGAIDVARRLLSL